MQYILKITAIGVDYHVFRVVSVDGKDDAEHVLNLINLGFDYGFYINKQLYFANTMERMNSLSPDSSQDDDDHYGPVADLKSSFFKDDVNVNDGSFSHINLMRDPIVAYDRFDKLIEGERARLQDKDNDMHPAQAKMRFKFVYQVNELRHIVEVMTSSEDLKCFIPATLMGGGFIVDLKNRLEPSLINECISNANARGLDETVRIDECNARMSAYQKARKEELKDVASLTSLVPDLKFKYLELNEGEDDNVLAVDRLSIDADMHIFEKRDSKNTDNKVLDKQEQAKRKNNQSSTNKHNSAGAANISFKSVKSVAASAKNTHSAQAQVEGVRDAESDRNNYEAAAKISLKHKSDDDIMAEALAKVKANRFEKGETPDFSLE